MFLSKKFLKLISEGNEMKFGAMVEFYSDELFLFAIGFVKKKEIAEEIVSDVFVKIWENRKKLTEINNLKSFLYTCVKNSSVSYIRKNYKHKLISLDELEDFLIPDTQSTENDIIDSEILKEIHQAIDNLPAKCKIVFSLAKFNNLKHKEIAEILEISEKTVNNHLVLALKKLKEKLRAPK